MNTIVQLVFCYPIGISPKIFVDVCISFSSRFNHNFLLGIFHVDLRLDRVLPSPVVSSPHQIPFHIKASAHGLCSGCYRHQSRFLLEWPPPFEVCSSFTTSIDTIAAFEPVPHCQLGQHTATLFFFFFLNKNKNKTLTVFHQDGRRAVKITTRSLHLLCVSDNPLLMVLVILIKAPINSHMPHHDTHPASWKSI